MTLGEKLKKMGNRYVYIGCLSKAGFFEIAKANEIDLDKLNDEALAHYQKVMRNSTAIKERKSKDRVILHRILNKTMTPAELEMYAAMYEKERPRSANLSMCEKATRMVGMLWNKNERELASARKRCRDVTVTLKKWTHLAERTIIDEYDRQIYGPFGKILIINGDCSPYTYWTFEERLNGGPLEQTTRGNDEEAERTCEEEC